MYFRKIIIFALLGFCSIIKIHAQDKNTVIGKVTDRGIVFTADSLLIKNMFHGFIRNTLAVTDSLAVYESSSIDKISIEKGKIRGTDTEFYFLLARDFSLNLKVASILHKVGDDLILFYNDASLTHDEQNLRMIYMVCHGTDDNCFPTLAVTEKGRIYWTSSLVMQYYCDPNDPCKTAVSLITD